ncbi:prolyl oligopeptidase family serine peptidase [Robertkochia aurantiaca]|uniref:prolyl oligopeptidase family serine peptidase n=1 Tax=Robertkochia aurantiaca TaxID=2873700 RepID=UPI001CD0089B|nr:prolyl oligopeptidase family serine peptidase [Robertkochia sp. 3YJGBD-33]
MYKIYTLIVAAALVASCDTTEQKKDLALKYPATKKVDTSDTYFGKTIKDPYRWLEDDRSAETESWVKAQNEVTFGYLEEIPFRDQLEERLKDLWNYEKITSPYKEGDYTYYSKNNGLQNQYVVYRKDAEGNEEVFLDPNTFSEDGTTSLAGLSFSDNGKLAAYAISEGGSDWRKIIVIDAETKERVGDTITDVKFSGISWKENEGFFYSSYDKPEGSELSAKTDQHKLYYHKLGTPQAEDEVIFGGTEAQKHRYVQGRVTEDNRFLVISAANSTAGNKLFVKDLSVENAPLKTIMGEEVSETGIFDSKGTTLYLVTDLDASNKRIVKTDIDDPAPDNWTEVIPETEHVLSASKGAGYIFAEYMIDAVSKVYQYDYDGNRVREIELPGIGSAGNFNGKEDAEFIYYSYANYNTPGSIYKLEPDSGDSELYWKPNINFDSEKYTSEQVFYTSKDGTKVPMIITYKKGLEKNGNNPTILYGYGGFNVSLTPSFSTAMAVWLEQGGIYAVPNIRGGGEYGKKWHDAGTKMQKQNVFDDFIAAGEFLIEENYTSSDRLAIRGGSNGGLLVGATMTQRPDLMKVALPAVGVLDMLRYHTFTAGAGWAYDYGTSEQSPEMFEYLLNYSPVHNVKEGKSYPATLITTGDHDDRVVPAHSFKFAAELQEKQSGTAPVLIRIETNAGHGAGTPVSKTIEQYADIFSFTLYNMGYEELPDRSVLKELKD